MLPKCPFENCFSINIFEKSAFEKLSGSSMLLYYYILTQMQATPQLINPLTELKEQRQSILGLIEKIRSVSQKLQYQGIERINSTALFEVKAKHTNEFTVELGAGYFAQLTAEQAVKLFQRRLKNIELQVQKYEQQREQTKQKKETISGKSKSVKIEEGNKRTYMEVIGQENGEEIFNIVEIEDDDQIEVPHNTLTQNTSAPTANKQNGLTEVNNIDHLKENNKVDATTAFTAAAPEETPNNDEDNDLQKSQKSQKSQVSQVSEQSQNEYGDLIHYHRKKIMKIPSASVSTPEIETPKASTTKSMQEISQSSDPSRLERSDSKKKKRVSFADEQAGGRLEQMLKDEEEQKEKKKEKEQAKETKAESKKEEKKQVKKEEKHEEKIPKDDFQSLKSNKISRFKLQRIKARLQKQGK